MLTGQRRSRLVYVVSIVAMVAALLFEVAVALPLDLPNALLWVELVCIAAFGVSWLTESWALLATLGNRPGPTRRRAEARIAMAAGGTVRLSGR